jgi:hypothetical protein
MRLRHLRFLALLQMVQGEFECVGGLLFALSPGGAGTSHSSPAIWISLCLTGLGISLLGALRLVAGVSNMFYRGRRLGIVSVIGGLLTVVTCCGLPSSVALCAYGLTVYTNGNIRRAFAMRRAGASSGEIERALS